MKDYLTILVIFCLCVATPTHLLTQEDYLTPTDSLSTHLFSASVNRGFLVPHHELMNYYLQDKTTSFSASIEKQLKGGWSANYGFISKGIEVSRSSLGNNEILGFSTHLIGYMNCALHSKGRGKLKIGTGVAVISQKFDLEKNVKNIAIGTTVNGAVLLEYSYEIPIYKGYGLSPHLRFTHFSNGAYKLPNLGLNLVSAGLSLQKTIGNLASDAEVKKVPTPTQRIAVSASLGRHELKSTGSGQFLNSNLGVQYINSTASKFIWGTGIDAHYSGAYANYYLETHGSAQSVWPSLRTGGHGLIGLKLGISEFHANVGYYFIDTQNLDGRLYQRLYILTRLTSFLDLKIGLKAHKTVAETFEIGLSTNLWSK